MTSANAIREIRNKICFLECFTELVGAAECAFKRPRDKPETKIRLKTTEAARTTHNISPDRAMTISRTAWCGNRLWIDSLDNGGDALSDADAHGRQAIAAAALFHFVNQRRHDPGAAATERMTQGDGAAVDVQFLEIDAELAGTRQHLRGERF